MKSVLAFGLILLAIACSLPRKAELIDGRVISVRYKYTSNGPVCRDSSGTVVQPYNISKITKR